MRSNRMTDRSAREALKSFTARLGLDISLVTPTRMPNKSTSFYDPSWSPPKSSSSRKFVCGEDRVDQPSLDIRGDVQAPSTKFCRYAVASAGTW